MGLFEILIYTTIYELPNKIWKIRLYNYWDTIWEKCLSCSSP